MVRRPPAIAPLLGGIGGFFGGLVFLVDRRGRRPERVPLPREPEDGGDRRGLRRPDRTRRVPPRAAGGAPHPERSHVAGRSGDGRRARVSRSACTTMVRRGGGRSTSRGLHRVDSVRAEVDTRGRLVVIGLVVVALFAGLLTRLWFLQVAGGESLAVAAQANSDEIVQVPALRGRILDAKGRVLAETRAGDRARRRPPEAHRSTTRPKLVPSLAPRARRVTPEEVNKRLDNVSNLPFEAVTVAERRHRRSGRSTAGAPRRLPGHADHVEASSACTVDGERSPPTCSGTRARSTPRSTRRTRPTATRRTT